MGKKKKGKAIFRKFQSMMIDAIKAYPGQTGRRSRTRQAREHEGILYAVNAMFALAVKKQALTGEEWDADIAALKAAIEYEGLQLPAVDLESGRDNFLDLVYDALRRKFQSGLPEGVPQLRKDEAILWASSRLAHLADEVRELEEEAEDD